jgi:hypothetical protein
LLQMPITKVLMSNAQRVSPRMLVSFEGLLGEAVRSPLNETTDTPNLGGDPGAPSDERSDIRMPKAEQRLSDSWTAPALDRR